MGIFDRLGTVIKSYISDTETAPKNKGYSGRYSSIDPDLDAAFEELDDYLGRGGSLGRKGQDNSRKEQPKKLPPEELRKDFLELGVPFGAPPDECKAAYKRLLKIHHPDRHAAHAGNFKKATDRTARINAAWDRIERWQAAN